jgi:hypothetical protein
MKYNNLIVYISQAIPLKNVEHRFITNVCMCVCLYVFFAKFVHSPYYSESELCGGAVTVSFLKYLPWQAMHFLQRSTHSSKTCCRPLITSKFLASQLLCHGPKSPEIAWGKIWIEFCVRLGKSGSAIQSRPRTMRFLGFRIYVCMCVRVCMYVCV